MEINLEVTASIRTSSPLKVGADGSASMFFHGLFDESFSTAQVI
jgi:hypothetical protein